MKTLRERLAYAMQTTGKTSQTDLGKQAGVPQSSISKILRGDSETSRHSGRLAAALGVSADWLINGNGSIFGEKGTALQTVDVSKNVKLYDAKGFTGEFISWFSALPEHFRAYTIENGSGVAQAPAGAIIIVNPSERAAPNDLVAVHVDNNITVFRYHVGGNGSGYLSVDDPRVPLAEVSPSSLVVGPIVQVFIPELNR